jgi:3-oxo-5alpha-steroid 4-dehydrogenase
MPLQSRYDVIVVGYGIAGVTAAIEAADAGASVLALDRGYGGGASALSGGVVYAGGGTRYQLAAGVTDTPDNMARYLRQETRGVVSDGTLRRFCETSPAMIDWLEAHGARFSGTLCPYKTSYPTDAHYLYYSGNEKAWPYAEHADPAPRGHRQVARGLSSGHDLLAALMESATRKGVAFRPLSRAHALISDEDGSVRGVRYRTVDVDARAIGTHRRLTAVAGKLGNWLPQVGKKFGRRAEAIWQAEAVEAEDRADAVIISAGGFVFNRQMKAKYAGGFADIVPLGTIGDDGTGINLGVAAGGSTDHLERMTAWRFLSPPSALVEGVTVGPDGDRIANEDLYGATHSQVMVDRHGGRGFLIVDAAVWRKARRQIRYQTQSFQKVQAVYLFSAGHRKGGTLGELAARIGVPAEALLATVGAYNDGIASGDGDPAHKAPELCTPVQVGPFYAIDISIKNSPLFPAPGLTLGGLRVDEDTGQVLTADDAPVPGLYAAGRTAIGICSNSYVSGLSLADGIFSGRRAGGHAAGSRSSATTG